jgi:hypothetical protein
VPVRSDNVFRHSPTGQVKANRAIGVTGAR